jgi:hypothetical protein
VEHQITKVPDIGMKRIKLEDDSLDRAEINFLQLEIDMAKDSERFLQEWARVFVQRHLGDVQVLADLLLH